MIADKATLHRRLSALDELHHACGRLHDTGMDYLPMGGSRTLDLAWVMQAAVDTTLSIREQLAKDGDHAR